MTPEELPQLGPAGQWLTAPCGTPPPAIAAAAGELRADWRPPWVPLFVAAVPPELRADVTGNGSGLTFNRPLPTLLLAFGARGKHPYPLVMLGWESPEGDAVWVAYGARFDAPDHFGLTRPLSLDGPPPWQHWRVGHLARRRQPACPTCGRPLS